MSFATLRSQVNQLVAAGNSEAAWQLLLSALQEGVTTQAAVMVVEQARQFDLAALGLTRTRVALLGSFTLEPLVPLVQARAYLSRIAPECYVGAFNAWQTQALDPESGLWHFAPDVIILAVRPEELVPRLTFDFAALEPADVQAELERAQHAFEGFFDAVRARTTARIIAHNFPAPLFPTLGILDANRADGQQSAFAELNARLRATIRQHRDIWILDAARLQAEVGYERWFDARLWALAKLPLSAAAQLRLTGEYVRFLRAFYGASKKVLALDLDNVLWGGILGEDGLDGIQLGTEYPGSAYVDFQRAVLDLYNRGVLLAIASKNDEADALEALAQHPAMLLRPKHFAARRINWQDKAENLVSLADELNLKLDSFVFADDSAVEVSRVREALPAVLTLHVAGEPAARAAWLRGLGVFDTLAFSDEDRARGALYAQEAERTQLRASMTTLQEFLSSLGMELTILPLDSKTLDRAAQLTQRTNQFNLTTRRYTAADLERLRATPGVSIWLAQLHDRFGDSGIIGLAITRVEGIKTILDTFLLSCRVVGRGVEGAFLTFVLEQARDLGLREMVAEYIPTLKNQLAAHFLAEQGFVVRDDGVWSKPLADYRADAPAWIRLIAPVLANPTK